jgi:hypothetical protein
MHVRTQFGFAPQVSESAVVALLRARVEEVTEQHEATCAALVHLQEQLTTTTRTNGLLSVTLDSKTKDLQRTGLQAEGFKNELAVVRDSLADAERFREELQTSLGNELEQETLKRHQEKMYLENKVRMYVRMHTCMGGVYLCMYVCMHVWVTCLVEVNALDSCIHEHNVYGCVSARI